MKVYLVFTASASFLGRAIRWLTRRGASHALVLAHQEALGAWFVVESAADGVEVRPAGQLNLQEVVEVFQLRDGVDGRAFMRALLSRLGRPYDVASILFWAAASAGNRIAGRERWEPRWSVPGALYCSELIAEALSETILPLSTTKLNPGQLAALLGSGYAEAIAERAPVSVLSEVK